MEPSMTAMDADHSSSSAGESELAAIAEENQNGSSSSSSSARSYDCIFCKRGFSNAQALGGHMNIHRKDRAKIKQPASHNRPPLPLTDKPVIHPSYYPAMRESLLMPQRGPAGDDTGFSFKWPWIGPRGEGFPGERSWEIGPHQQPLFVEEAWLGGARPPYLLHGRHEVEGLGGETPAVMELDLELRLGPQPQSASMRLKRFL